MKMTVAAGITVEADSVMAGVKIAEAIVSMAKEASGVMGVRAGVRLGRNEVHVVEHRAANGHGDVPGEPGEEGGAAAQDAS